MVRSSRLSTVESHSETDLEMEAIVQMVVALIAAFVAMAVATFALVAQLVLLLLSLLFVLLTEGFDAARKHYRDKTTKEPATEEQNDIQQDTTAKQLNPRAFMIFGAVVFTGFLLGFGFWLQHYWEQKKIEATNRQLTQIATQLESDTKNPETPNPVAGPLAERDLWQRPIECFVDETLIGTLLVIRSNGPDRRPGTADDLLEIRTIPTTVKKFGKDVAKRAWDAAQAKMKKMLRGDAQ